MSLRRRHHIRRAAAPTAMRTPWEHPDTLPPRPRPPLRRTEKLPSGLRDALDATWPKSPRAARQRFAPPQARGRRSRPAGLQARDRRSSATAGHLLTATDPPENSGTRRAPAATLGKPLPPRGRGPLKGSRSPTTTHACRLVRSRASPATGRSWPSDEVLLLQLLPHVGACGKPLVVQQSPRPKQRPRETQL
jgi:hypothetical protein